jgi:hypothetical protein
VFAAVISRDQGCPWGTTGLTTTTWLDVPVHDVNLSELIATQPGLLIGSLISPTSSPDPMPHVIAWDGRLYLEDGHHRAMRAMLRGETTIHARVLPIG